MKIFYRVGTPATSASGKISRTCCRLDLEYHQGTRMTAIVSSPKARRTNDTRSLVGPYAWDSAVSETPPSAVIFSYIAFRPCTIRHWLPTYQHGIATRAMATNIVRSENWNRGMAGGNLCCRKFWTAKRC